MTPDEVKAWAQRTQQAMEALVASLMPTGTKDQVIIKATLDDSLLFWIYGPAVYGVRGPESVGKLSVWQPNLNAPFGEN